MRRSAPAAAFLAAALGAAAVPAASPPAPGVPFVPEADGTVLERLPGQARDDPDWREIRRLRRASAIRHDPVRAASLAWRYLAMARRTGDPRFRGYAESAVARWLREPEPPPGVLLVRATLRQGRHRFDAALADLDRVLRRDPRDARAWLTRATVLELTGRPREALASCAVLARLTRSPAAAACTARALDLTGRSEAGYRLLDRALRRDRRAPAALRGFALGTLAAIAARLGRHRRAESLYREALATGPRDDHLLESFAEHLLDRGRPRDVVRLLDRERRSDGQRVALARAERRLGHRGAAKRVADIARRLAAGRRAGGIRHLATEARAALYLRDRPADALRLAGRSWSIQRSPRDALVYLDAAIAAGNPAAAAPVFTWMAHTGIRDRALDARAARLGGVP